jgi:purine-binding chemotaxis protein CheW
MPAVSPDSVAASSIGLGCFEVGGRIYALDVTQLREVLRWQPVTPLPGAPRLIEGVIDVRGAIVPVLDLGRVLGGEPVRAGSRARIAIAELDGLVLGLGVDAAAGVIAVQAEALGDPPALATQAGYALARALVRRPQAEPILVLALEQVLERVYRSSIAPEGQT